jgi:hypothetical protein
VIARDIVAEQAATFWWGLSAMLSLFAAFVCLALAMTEDDSEKHP